MAETITALSTIQLWFNYFTACLKSLVMHFPWRLRREISLQLVLSVMSHFLCVGMIAPARQYPVALPEQQVTRHAQVCHRTSFKALSISGQISSQPAAIPSCSVLTAKAPLPKSVTRSQGKMTLRCPYSPPRCVAGAVWDLSCG